MPRTSSRRSHDASSAPETRAGLVVDERQDVVIFLDDDVVVDSRRKIGYGGRMAGMGVYSNDRDPAGMCSPRVTPHVEDNMSHYTPEKKLPMASECYVPGRFHEGPVDPSYCVSAHPHLADDAKPHPGLRMNPNPEGITFVDPPRPAEPSQATPASETWWGRAAGRAWSPIQQFFQSFGDDHEPEPTRSFGAPPG